MKKCIPPFLFLICIFLMIGIDIQFESYALIRSPFNYLGIVLILIGLSIAVIVSKKFSKIQTEIHTFKPPRQLVTDGLFRVSRNPIYLGFTIGLVGVWGLLGTVLPVFGCVLFVAVAHFWYIPFEERSMLREFGEAYEQYKLVVRRWI